MEEQAGITTRGTAMITMVGCPRPQFLEHDRRKERPMNDPANPLRRLDDWEEFVQNRYPAPDQKAKQEYRNYDAPARDTVRTFYRLNHRYQTYDFVRQKKQQ